MIKFSCKKNLFAIFLLIMILALTACGKEKEEQIGGNVKELAEGILMVIGNESVSYEEAFAYIYIYN